MPAEIDIQALSKRRDEIQQEIDAAYTQYQELQKTDPWAAQKLSDSFKPKVQLLDEFDFEIASKKQELMGELESGKYLMKGVLSGKQIQTDEKGRVVNAEELGLNDPYQTSAEYFNRRTEEVLSTITGEKVKMDEGLSGPERVHLALFSPEKRDELMRRRFGDNAKTINIGGQRFQMFKEGNTWKPVNPIGYQLSDLAMIPAEVIPTAGAMAGAVLGTGATGGPWGGAMGAAAGYAGAGTMQDQVMSAISGLERNLANDFGRRSMEGMVGIPFDRGFSFLAAPLAKKPARAASQQTFRDVMIAEEQYLAKKRGITLNASDIMEGGLEKAERRAQAAIRRPQSALGRDFEEVIYRAKQFQASTPKAEKADNLYKSALENLKHSAQQSKRMVQVYNKRAAEILENVQRQKMEALVPTYKEGAMDSIGQRLSKAVTEAGNAAERAKNEIYNQQFYPKAIPAVGDIDPVEFAKIVERGHYSEAARSAEVETITMELRERPKNLRRIQLLERRINSGKMSPKNRDIAEKTIADLRELAGPLDAKAMDKYIRRLRKAHPETLIGGTEQQIAAGRAADAADVFRKQLYKDRGVLDLYDQATRQYDAFRQFDKGQLGSMLQDALGEAAKTPTQITKAMTSDPQTATKVLSAIRDQAPQSYGDALNLTREAYLRRAGIQESQGMLPSKLTHDKEMINALWGRDEFGRATPGAAKRMNDILDQLNKDFKTYKLDASKIKVEDLNKLQSAFDPHQFKVIKRNIVERAKNQEEAEKALATSLIKVAKQGHREAVQSHEFPRAMWKASSDDLKIVLRQFKDPKELENLKGDFMEYFFAKYAPQEGTYGTYGRDLWDGQRFLADIAENPKIKNNIRAVVGQEMLDDMIAYSTVIQAAKRPRIGSNASMGGAKVGEQKVNVFLTAGSLPERLADRYHSAMYRAGQLPRLLKLAQKGKDITPKAWDDAYQDALKKMFMTSAGVQALALTGRHDPNWGGHLGEMFGNLPVLEAVLPEGGIPGAQPMSEPSDRRYK